MTPKPDVYVIGGGMITQVQLLPSLYYFQHMGLIGEIHVSALTAEPLAALQADDSLKAAFPGHGFTPWPDPADGSLTTPQPDLYKNMLAAAPENSIAVVAVPDQLHYAMVMDVLNAGLHCLVVKPLVLKHKEAEDIARLAYDKGLVVGVEYHKRFDPRNLVARANYRDGKLGEFMLGQAHLHEPWYYRDSNFQNWCTCENSDFFTYVGCHYVDLVAFITGLKPVAVSVYGKKDAYPNGREGFLYTDARVIWENGAALSVANALGYPNSGAGGNSQGMTLWGKGDNDATLLAHSDQYRGIKASYSAAGTEPGDTQYAEPSHDYYRLLDIGGAVRKPIGYGHESVGYILNACIGAAELASLEDRQALIRRYDEEGVMATPANSDYNELVIEAGRLSILNGGRRVNIDYENSTVSFAE